MQGQYRPTQAEINLDHLRHNVDCFRKALPEGVLFSACVKANAYGHGAVEIAKELERLDVDYLNVAFLDEALELRQAGVRSPILVLGYTPPEGIEVAYKHQITVTVFSEEVLQSIEALEPFAMDDHQDISLKVHLKIDSGMGRLGVITAKDAEHYAQRLKRLSYVMLEGVYTHFAKADEEDKAYTLIQYQRFMDVVSALRNQGYSIPIIHTGNSAAAIDTPTLSLDMVRVGISLYGLYPSAEVDHDAVHLLPVLTLTTKIVYVKEVPEHWGISYGTRYYSSKDEKIGTLPIGYADGFSRMLGGKVEVLVRGRRVPVVGTICMDQCMVSLQSLNEEQEDIKAGEEVVIIGQQMGSTISADELASKLGTINYEVICMLANRIPRVYMRSGQVISRVNSLLS
ncbi:alanine racemase [Paenibacillus urinalis]|uniref:Alanine racemase n=1 Tax=Paenibacillus urinalis TaxID=521520 RepID=A0ABY7XCJ9_9BACL|nr:MULTISPECIES: alanine racemase [Paenibacillus]WDH95305.1 alanine racemase [Paenibacillus urinalis]WDI03500.1 alanine racemase [Paenibacillus urinalis]GAK41046.1 alanine racemase 1 [Paenibacillus sp. TCA20]